MIHVYEENGSHKTKIEGTGLELAAEISLIIMRFTKTLRNDNVPEQMIKLLIESILHAAFSDEEEE